METILLHKRPMVDPLQTLPPLTDKQLHLLAYLAKYFRDNRYLPTRREIADFLQIKSPNSTPYVDALVKKGYLAKLERGRRNLQLTEAGLLKLEMEGLAARAQKSLFDGNELN